MTQPTVDRDRELNHNDQCVGCYTHRADNCPPWCPFESGEFGPAVILRAAASRLPQHPAGIGYDISGAVYAAAVTFVGREQAWTATVEASSVLADYLVEQWGERAKSIRDQVVYRHGLFADIKEMTVSLYGAAARHDGIEFDPNDVL